MTLRDAGQILGGLVFLTFVVLIARAAWAADRRSPAAHRRAVQWLLVSTVVVSFTPGLARRELWPFSSWSMMANAGPERVQHVLAYGVTSGGVEVPIDPRVWEPVMWAELSTWIHQRLPQLSPAERDQAGAYLLERANGGWQRLVETGEVGTLDRWLGPFRAPEHMLVAHLWRPGASLPPGPFVGVRVVWERWNTDDRYRPAAVEREIIYESPEVR